MKIYRIQDKDGRGPYKRFISLLWIDPDGHTNPSWIQEFGMKSLGHVPIGHHIGCGFRNMDQLHNWFSDRELEKLEALGYDIVSMDATKILGESKIQLIFSRDKPLNQDFNVEKVEELV